MQGMAMGQDMTGQQLYDAKRSAIFSPNLPNLSNLYSLKSTSTCLAPQRAQGGQGEGEM